MPKKSHEIAPGLRNANREFMALAGREREMLHLMAKGATNAEIAGLLSLTPKTVANCVPNILHKLQVADSYRSRPRGRAWGRWPLEEILASYPGRALPWSQKPVIRC